MSSYSFIHLIIHSFIYSLLPVSPSVLSYFPLYSTPALTTLAWYTFTSLFCSVLLVYQSFLPICQPFLHISTCLPVVLARFCSFTSDIYSFLLAGQYFLLVHESFLLNYTRFSVVSTRLPAVYALMESFVTIANGF